MLLVEDEESLLDLGAGTGVSASFLVDHGYSVTAVEWSDAGIDCLRRRAASRPGLRVIQGDYLTVDMIEHTSYDGGPPVAPRGNPLLHCGSRASGRSVCAMIAAQVPLRLQPRRVCGRLWRRLHTAADR